MIWTNCAKSTTSTEPAQSQVVYEAEVFVNIGLASASQTEARGWLDQVAYLCLTNRSHWLTDVASASLSIRCKVQFGLPLPHSKLQAKMSEHKKTNQTRHLCYQTSAIVDIIVIIHPVIRHHQSSTSLLSDIIVIIAIIHHFYQTSPKSRGNF